MNAPEPGRLQPMDILRAVRNGYALATPSQIALIRRCDQFEILEGGWIPRWALEAIDLLEEAGCSPAQIGELFALGRDAIKAELARLVRHRRLAHTIELRRPYERLPIDLPTEMALRAALQHHRAMCTQCKFAKPCAEGQSIQDELELLFPRDRRGAAREPHVA